MCGWLCEHEWPWSVLHSDITQFDDDAGSPHFLEEISEMHRGEVPDHSHKEPKAKSCRNSSSSTLDSQVQAANSCMRHCLPEGSRNRVGVRARGKRLDTRDLRQDSKHI